MTSLSHSTSTVTSAADREVVALTHHGREKYVLMRVEEYEKLAQRGRDPRHVGYVDEMPEPLRELFLGQVRDRSVGDLNLVEGEASYDPSHRVQLIADDDQVG
ncbi:type II toxin-antitoxin system prevent-host-death family antitoxin [Jiella endophytica]|uniref:Type II toxin-antitoxin system prevent-host-death family antitoxin n=2 Tax=Jiella endophytica TaxID=2558362 RepID=A0A4Y8RHL0_9HYPH|nr:type II toxin-antitoxin system prevent-host-death family antitoxin [Jiella endophytica]